MPMDPKVEEIDSTRADLGMEKKVREKVTLGNTTLSRIRCEVYGERRLDR